MFSVHIRTEILQRLREEYPPGTEVELIEMSAPYRDMPDGMKRKVLCVDDTGTVHVAWENGSTLGAAYGFDRIRRIDENRCMAESDVKSSLSALLFLGIML